MTGIKKAFFLLFFMITVLWLWAINSQEMKGSSMIKFNQIIPYIAETPLIDGNPDKCIDKLPFYVFNQNPSDESQTPIPVRFKIAYNSNFLYLYIESDKAKFTFRDRAYQHGDGFLLLIAGVKPDGSQADEFYELACSAVDKPELEWSRHFFWNYNVNKIFQKTSPNTLLEFSENQGKTAFELLLPWEDVKPWHPFIHQEMGINLSLNLAIEPSGVNQYSLINDPQRPLSKRNYLSCQFEAPIDKKEVQCTVIFPESHLTENQNSKFQMIAYAPRKSSEQIVFTIRHNKSGYVENFSHLLQLKKGKNLINLNKTLNLTANTGYEISWYLKSDPSQKGTHYFTVFPPYNFQQNEDKILVLKDQISSSSYHTLQFQNKECKQLLTDLKFYEKGEKEFIRIKRLQDYIKNIGETKNDQILNTEGLIRKAYLSKLDQTYQPYVLYIPKNYNPNEKYALMVYLHGSESTETDIVNIEKCIPDHYIGLGVFGRGMSNAFMRDHAPDDILEAINAVRADYSIQEGKILLTGFSMGGYGVYYNYSLHPELYNGIAVFSGLNRIGEYYSKGIAFPDFSDQAHYSQFKDVSVFIYHGKEDRNVDFKTIKVFAEALSQINPKVIFYQEADSGHQIMSEKAIEQFKQFADRLYRE
jgi:predicted esterase